MADAVPVLVVDDDPALTRTLADILPLHGFEAHTAPTGRTALDIARRMVPIPAVAVVDLRLPDMDGLDLAAELHAQSRQLQVVILTGNGTLETAIRALRDQNTDYLLKPVDPELLIRTLRTAEGRWRLRLAEDELHRTQSLLATVFDASPLAIVVLDPDLTVRFWSRAAERLFGRRAEDAVGRPAGGLGLVPDVEGDRVMRGALLGESRTGVDFRQARPDGSELDLRLGVAALSGPGGASAGLVAVYEDITDRRRLEERLQDVQRLDAMGRVAGGVAHDFNNLLSVVLVEAETGLQDPGLRPPFDEILGGIKAAGQRGAAMTRQLLSFARRQPAEPTLENANEVLREGRRLLERLAGDRVRVEVALADDLAPVRIDRGQLEQVLSNLVVNARDAMPDGGTLTIGTANVVVDETAIGAGVDRGDWVRLSVRDTGTGIPDEVRARIFEPFFTTKARESGTGLGLATCYGIVERFGGAITLDTRMGAGTTFHVYLPRAGDSPAPSRPSAPEPASSRGTESILVVDDQTALRAIARTALGQRGYAVTVARSGAEALEVAETMSPPPALIFTDLSLPDLDGRELVERLRVRHPGLRALITSGSVQRSEDVGRIPFLPKPYRLDAMIRRVRQLLDQPASASGG